LPQPMGGFFVFVGGLFGGLGLEGTEPGGGGVMNCYLGEKKKKNKKWKALEAWYIRNQSSPGKEKKSIYTESRI